MLLDFLTLVAKRVTLIYFFSCLKLAFKVRLLAAPLLIGRAGEQIHDRRSTERAKVMRAELVFVFRSPPRLTEKGQLAVYLKVGKFCQT